jgi:glycosyltransferase involved in cell wall biosynthesis
MHILITANSSWYALNFRRSLIEALIAAGHRVSVLAPRDEHSDALILLGTEFRVLDMDPKGLSPAANLGLLLRFLAANRALRPDAVVSFTIKNNIFGALAARFQSVPFIPGVSGLGTAFLSGASLRFVAETLYRIAFRNSPAVFFENGDDMRLFRDRGLIREAQARLVPGAGIDLAHFRPAPLEERTRGDTTFLLIARLLRDKGVLEFVEAARRLKRTHPALRFQLLGFLGAENRTAIRREEVEAWTEEGVVEYLGATADVRPFIAAADCVVLPSYREGAPRTLLEAAAMARPIIATDVPGCREVVEEGRNGFLCAARDAGDLSRRMLDFLALSGERRREMGLASRRLAEERFDERIVIDAYLEAIDRAVTGRRARSPL